MIDAHCHLNATYTAESVGNIIDKFVASQGERIVDVTTSSEDFLVSQRIISQYPDLVFSTVGFHPESPDGVAEAFEKLIVGFTELSSTLPNARNIVGIGETGIDYSFFANFPSTHVQVLEQQRELFVKHIALAKQFQLPLVIHARGRHLLDYSAYSEILSILLQERFQFSVYFHSFGGDYQLAKKIVDAGYFIGVNGIVTYSNAKAIAEVATKIPSEFLVLETDSPFLIPSNLERKLLENPKINEPIGVLYTAKRVATLRQIQLEEVLQRATNATKKLFAKML
ncbi:hypothetical protein CO112_02460 [Candidatus Dojkabacteria bacterium CG_4_9_14_3_um_filter_150_Dojkabacteria_WS6_41_13]|uniref:Hydrolase TatD n=1 Tax=Candidatus Dojkabacteria bacterium CG_4_10_14_0_2_um_filter_Dojkabacteria_WS6_41_15 TaxID=2014249 RepID=A0A2M7W0X7_9BACT|nr:MAG: hypothetical protein COZ14_00545 [Candidatus Dojkabacteria bacterium CG_4_10_14_3_um_filter_Dojkabacteria_WS6_41_9]PJA12621.1 MAG: hypothetical protein COX64_04300 [Candidatus Dojkabacteria bacterium CG_4_10_14_0_2_um_filter_Dojkabacteria_WS6_41_15]PJB22789.1 MAG: hypothetical protein CO112_02460 [Candidatus Dojkabacteria bacterium CG_4_9_14_3_um_filter_150_Dojkabacteria_WS6_41_13]